MSAPPHRSLAFRVFRATAGGLGVLVLFLVSLVAGALVSLDVPRVRRLAMNELNAILAPQFKGTITVERLAHLSIFGVRGVDATITAADGTKVIIARGVAARIAPLSVLKGALFGLGDRHIPVASITVDAVDVNLDSGPDGSPKLVGAFDPKVPPPANVPKTGRGLAIDLQAVSVTHVWVHGAIQGAPTIDADVDAIKAAFLSASDTTKLDLAHLTFLARGLPMGVAPRGTVHAKVTLPADPKATMTAEGGLDGAVGAIPLIVSGAFHDNSVDATLDVPRVSAENVRASVEGVPVYDAVSAHAEAHGPLAALKVALHASVGEGSVDAVGDVDVAGPLAGHVTLTAKGIDARAFASDGPRTDLGVKIVASADTAPGGALEGHAVIDVPVGSAAGQRVPHALIHADVVRGAEKEGAASLLTAHVTGIVDEPGAPLALTADIRSREGRTAADFGVKIDAPRLQDIERVPGIGSGAAEITVKGHAEIDKTLALAGQLDASVQRYSRPGIKVNDLTLTATAEGNIKKPVVRAHVLAHGLSVSGQDFGRLEVYVEGTPAKSRVTLDGRGIKLPNVRLSGDVGLAPDGKIVAHDIALTVVRDTKFITAAIASASFGNGSMDATGVSLQGAGAPLDASFRTTPTTIVIKARTAGLDLATLGYLGGLGTKLGGVLDVDVDVNAGRDRAKGNVAIELKHGEWTSVHEADAHIGLALDDRHISGGVRATLGDAGSFDLHDLDLHVGGSGPLQDASWRAAWGNVELALNVDLARVAELAPAATKNLTDIGGKISLTGKLARDSLQDLTPEIRLSLRTEGLSAAGQSMAPVRLPGGPLMTGPATWTWNGMDIDGDVIVDGADSDGEVAVRVIDKLGALVAFDLKTDPLPFNDVFAHGGDLTAALEALPIAVLIDVPHRDLEKLPLLIRPAGVKGAVDGTITMSGSARKPELKVALQTHALKLSGAPNTPVDGILTADYDGSVAKLHTSIKGDSSPLLDVESEVHAKVGDLLDAKGGALAWGASAKGTLARFPLAAVAVLNQDRIKGFVSGAFAVTDLHSHAQAKVDLAFDELRVGKAQFSKGSVNATLDDHGLNAKAELQGAAGQLEANAKVGMKWGADVVPSSDGSGIEASVQTKHLSAAMAAPFVTDSISELTGWLDAHASVKLAPGKPPAISGSLAFSDGTLQTPSLGEEFHDVKAKVTLAEDGTVKLEDVEARGLSGLITANGTARLQGVTLREADVTVNIAKGQGIPLDIQGTDLGSVYGQILIKATGSEDGKNIKIAVNVPKFHDDMPQAGLPRSPQALTDAPRVHIGVYRNPDRFILLPGDGAPAAVIAARNIQAEPVTSAGGVSAKLPPPPPPGAAQASAKPSSGTELDVTVHIGDVQIVRGTQLTVDLGGNLAVAIAEATKVRGKINLKSGKVSVQGKDFTIEKGTISFVGDDPSNPEINITAGWDAPDGTRVFADYVGPAKTGKVSLRSEPPRPKNEIVSLIAFGTDDGSSATPYASQSPNTGTEAASAVGGLTSDGITKGLDQLTGLNVTAKVDTSDSANPRPEVEVQIAKDISLELAFVLGTPPPGTNPDTTYATIDWRFVRDWSLETTFGDYGSTFADVVWQYRY